MHAKWMEQRGWAQNKQNIDDVRANRGANSKVYLTMQRCRHRDDDFRQEVPTLTTVIPMTTGDASEAAQDRCSNTKRSAL